MADPRPDLLDVGLHPGDVVRYRPRPNARWQEGTVERRERDGSIGVRDAKGAARALPVERLEVPTSGPRGARTWEPLADRAARDVQLDLFLDASGPPAGRDATDPGGAGPDASAPGGTGTGAGSGATRRRPTRRPGLRARR